MQKETLKQINKYLRKAFNAKLVNGTYVLYIYMYIYRNLPKNAIVRLPDPPTGEAGSLTMAGTFFSKKK